MYTSIKTVQILISLLKQFNISHVVLSPGTRNTPLAHSIETDDFFSCYSIVDERSAAYFALGLSEALDVPVCVSCTAATASCNYMPAIREANERNIQLVALTADQDHYQLFHMGEQLIDQVNMYKGHIRYSVNVPAIRNDRDYWYTNRCINEALLELNHHVKGPVQINYCMPYSLEELSVFDAPNLPVTRKITRYLGNIDWNESKEIIKGKKVLVICGSNFESSQELKAALKEFSEKYNTAIVYECYSNLIDNQFLHIKSLGEVINSDERKKLMPEIIITVGNVFYAAIKQAMHVYSGNAKHWHISADGIVNDGFGFITRVYECTPLSFFENININSPKNVQNTYHNIWKSRIDQIIIPELQFTNFKAILELSKVIPQNANLHMSVLDSIRLSDYVDFNSSVKCFANTGADGIDGAISTFLGQASTDINLSFLLIGDLSFLYDLNAVINKLSQNVRIFVINNYAGAEFHKNFGVEKIPSLNLHIAAGHKIKLQQCCAMAGVNYLSACSMEELQIALKRFIIEGEGPTLLEIFTDAELDAKTLKEYWQLNKETNTRGKFKELIKRKMGAEKFAMMKSLLRRN